MSDFLQMHEFPAATERTTPEKRHIAARKIAGVAVVAVALTAAGTHLYHERQQTAREQGAVSDDILNTLHDFNAYLVAREQATGTKLPEARDGYESYHNVVEGKNYEAGRVSVSTPNGYVFSLNRDLNGTSTLVVRYGETGKVLKYIAGNDAHAAGFETPTVETFDLLKYDAQLAIQDAVTDMQPARTFTPPKL